MSKNKWNRSVLYVVISTAVYMLFVIIITWLLMPYVDRLSETVYQEKLKEWIASMGIGGYLVVLGIQILQILVAFIPGEPIEILSGILYGTINGTILCLCGCVIASVFVFSLVRAFGMKLLNKIFGEEKVSEFAFLQDGKRIETVLFLLYLLPGTPKDMLTYLAGISSMKLTRFVLISTFARTPTILSSTLVGATMRHGNWGISALVFGCTALIGIIGIRYKDKVIAYCQKSGMNLKEKPEQ